MKKIRLSLLTLASVLIGATAYAQTLNLDFSVLDANSNTLGSGAINVGPSTPGTIEVIEIDLRSAGVCAGDQVFLKNNSSGWIYSNTTDNTISSTTEWAMIRGRYLGNLNFTSCGSYILGGLVGTPGELEQWSPNPLVITVPDATGCATNIGNGYHSACFLLSPDVYYYGPLSVANCERAIELRLIVNSRPACLDDLELCPSMKQTHIQTAIEDHIPSTLNAYDWSPFDPRITSFTTNTNFTFMLQNADGTGCARECNFNITWAQPTHQIIQNGSICEDQGPYLGITVDDLAASNISKLLINGTEVYPNPSNSTIFNDYFGAYDQLALTEPGTYIIQQEFTMSNGSICSKEYEVTIYERPSRLASTSYEFCEGAYQEICGPSSSTAGQNYQYTWSYLDVNQNVSVLVTNDQCFTPSQPGTYNLFTSNGPCSYFETITVTEVNAPIISVPDKIWCKKPPVLVSPQQSFVDPVSYYSWTYNGNSLSYTAWNIPYQGDGTYCVTVHWENGCESTDCFQVYRDCDPAPKSNFSTYPNPSKGEIQVIFKSSGQKEVVVRTADGRVLLTKNTIDTDRTRIDLSMYPKGIYFIQVTGEEGTSIEKVRVQ